MSTLNESIEMLKAMIEHEKTISLLYKAYAEKFPELKAFWTKLSKEEMEHASWIKKLQKRVEDGSEQVFVDRFPLGAINFSINHLKHRIDESQTPDLKIIKALSVAVDVELGLIEGKYFEVSVGDSDFTKSTLARLAKATQEHLQYVRKMWQDNR